MEYNAMIEHISSFKRFGIEQPCRFCEEPTTCRCGCCHSIECNKKLCKIEGERLKELLY